MGSRYGGLKQIDPVDEQGHINLADSIYEPKKAGCEKVVVIIKKENEADFKEAGGKRMEQVKEVSYVFQDLHKLPEGFDVPEGRVKPWGTAHKVFSCFDVMDGPFAVINADEYYGTDAFQTSYDELSTLEDDVKCRYTRGGYQLENSVTENGHVKRGVSTINEAGELVSVVERTRIEKTGDGAAYTEAVGETWPALPKGSIVSMHMWGCTASIFQESKNGCTAFLDEGL